MRYVGVLILCLVIMGCGSANHSDPTISTSNGSNGAHGSVSGAGFQAFESGFYQFAKSQNCVKCHATLISPKFGSSDPAQAYAEARPLLVVGNPANSPFATYAGNGHCSDTPCSNPANTATLAPMIAAWAAAESSSGGGNNGGNNGGGTVVPAKYVSASVTLPATIANYDAAANASTPLRFQLSQLNPATGLAKLATAIVEVEVRYTGPSQTHYRFTRMKVYATNQAGQNLNITGMHLYIRSASETGMGVEDLQQTGPWNNIGKPTALVAPIQARPATLPATPVNVTVFSTQSVIYPKLGAGDVVTIGFENLQ